VRQWEVARRSASQREEAERVDGVVQSKIWGLERRRWTESKPVGERGRRRSWGVLRVSG